MSDFILSVEGTELGRFLAMILALVSAIAHASFGAMQKGRYDPWTMRGAMDGFYFLMALPLALFVFPLPSAGLWVILLGAWFIHTPYKLFMAMAYSRGSYTAVYPVVRGTGPVITVLFAGMVFGEIFTPMQWGGVILLSGGILGLAAWNLRKTTVDKHLLWSALGLAVLTGVFVAIYTVYDAYGIRISVNPFTFLFWLFVIDGWTFPIIAMLRWKNMAEKPLVLPLMKRGFIGAILAFIGFGSVMMATRLDKVGEAAVLRETSTVFAALIGWLFLKETVGPVRAALMAIIALGAVVVEFGG